MNAPPAEEFRAALARTGSMNVSILQNAADKIPQGVSVLSVIGNIEGGLLAEPIRIIREKYQAELALWIMKGVTR